NGLGAFSSLKALPVDYLKIDGVFTRNLATDQVNREMVSAMIKLARTLEFRVIAEQVEQQEDFDWLRDHGVELMQGNFIEPPQVLGTGTTGTCRGLMPGRAPPRLILASVAPASGTGSFMPAGPGPHAPLRAAVGGRA